MVYASLRARPFCEHSNSFFFFLFIFSLSAAIPAVFNYTPKCALQLFRWTEWEDFPMWNPDHASEPFRWCLPVFKCYRISSLRPVWTGPFVGVVVGPGVHKAAGAGRWVHSQSFEQPTEKGDPPVMRHALATARGWGVQVVCARVGRDSKSVVLCPCSLDEDTHHNVFLCNIQRRSRIYVLLTPHLSLFRHSGGMCQNLIEIDSGILLYNRNKRISFSMW